MKVFEEFIKTIENLNHRQRVKEILNWVSNKFPDLKEEIKWNQPMFTHHGTFIIGFSVSKHHIALAPEERAINPFSAAIKKAGYSLTKGLIRIKWNESIDYSLLEKIIEFNIKDKADCTTFWR